MSALVSWRRMSATITDDSQMKDIMFQPASWSYQLVLACSRNNGYTNNLHSTSLAKAHGMQISVVRWVSSCTL